MTGLNLYHAGLAVIARIEAIERVYDHIDRLAEQAHEARRQQVSRARRAVAQRVRYAVEAARA